jgi:hypothetical protein
VQIATEKLEKRRKVVKIPGRDFKHCFVGALAMGSYYTYLCSWIAGEVAVFDSQGPGVVDRSAVLCESTGTLEKRRKVENPGQEYSKWRDNYQVGRIAGEDAVFDMQSPFVPDRAAVLQEICTQQLVQNGKQSLFCPGPGVGAGKEATLGGK